MQTSVTTPLGFNQWDDNEPMKYEMFSADNTLSNELFDRTLLTPETAALFEVISQTPGANEVLQAIAALLASKVNGINITAPINIYVDKSGNDTTGDGSESKPFLTIGKAVQHCQNNLFGGHSKSIIIGDGTYAENIDVRGLDTIEFTSKSANANNVIIEGTVNLQRCAYTTLNQLTIRISNGTSGTSVVYLLGGSHNITNCKIINTGAVKPGYAVNCAAGTMFAHTTEINNMTRGLCAINGGYISATGISGSGNDTAFYSYLGMLLVGGTNTIAATTMYGKSTGGVIFANGVMV